MSESDFREREKKKKKKKKSEPERITEETSFDRVFFFLKHEDIAERMKGDLSFLSQVEMNQNFFLIFSSSFLRCQTQFFVVR